MYWLKYENQRNVEFKNIYVAYYTYYIQNLEVIFVNIYHING